jgi:copper chaperone CopZ
MAHVVFVAHMGVHGDRCAKKLKKQLKKIPGT